MLETSNILFKINQPIVLKIGANFCDVPVNKQTLPVIKKFLENLGATVTETKNDEIEIARGWSLTGRTLCFEEKDLRAAYVAATPEAKFSPLLTAQTIAASAQSLIGFSLTNAKNSLQTQAETSWLAARTANPMHIAFGVVGLAVGAAAYAGSMRYAMKST